MLSPHQRGVFLDCTIGPGGHAEALLLAGTPDATLIGIDLDESDFGAARRRLERFGDRVRMFHAGFDQARAVLEQAGIDAVDIVLADLGFSSRQMDDPSRGLSFAMDGPLDMRLDRSEGQSAAELVNSLDEKSLADLIYRYGEERYSRRIAAAIVRRRKLQAIRRTTELAEIVTAAYPAPARRSRRGVHPATRTFQALRIAVNDELSRLEKLLEEIPRLLNVGGRAGIISFHSLEDRRVKHAFAEMAQGGEAEVLTKKPVTASDEEIERNPRSRSAKLRAVEKIAPGRAN